MYLVSVPVWKQSNVKYNILCNYILEHCVLFHIIIYRTQHKANVYIHVQGRIQDFKLGGADLKKLRRAEGGSKNFGVFRVKNHDFTPKNLIFSNFRGVARRVRPPPPPPPPLDPPLMCTFMQFELYNTCSLL